MTDPGAPPLGQPLPIGADRATCLASVGGYWKDYRLSPV